MRGVWLWWKWSWFGVWGQALVTSVEWRMSVHCTFEFAAECKERPGFIIYWGWGIWTRISESARRKCTHCARQPGACGCGAVHGCWSEVVCGESAGCCWDAPTQLRRQFSRASWSAAEFCFASRLRSRGARGRHQNRAGACNPRRSGPEPCANTPDLEKV